MNTLRMIFINWRKLWFYPGRAMFLILPLFILVMAGTVLASHSTNILAAAEQVIFGSAAEQNKYLQINKNGLINQAGRGGIQTIRIDNNNLSDTNYSVEDVNKVKTVANVETAGLQTSVPVSNVKAKEVISGKTLDITTLASLDSSLAGYYTSKEFNYTPGGVVPVIINKSTFNEMYEDWKGKTEITVEFPRPGSSTSSSAFSNDNLPIKNRAVEYNKDDILGKEFTLTVGGLDDFQTYTTTPTDAGIKYTKLDQEELDEKKQARKDAISPYWDYNKLGRQLSFKAVVVGIIEDDSDINTYIPQDFATQLVHDYIRNQVSLRTDKILDKEAISTYFKGLNYDGVQLRNSGLIGGRAVMLFRPRGDTAVSAGEDAPEQYEIPGLLINTVRDENSNNPFAQSEILGPNSDQDIWTKVTPWAERMMIKISDQTQRGQVVKDLNNLGYAYTDTSKSSTFDELAATLRNITILFAAIFVIVSVGAVTLTMSKFVSESKREIGIFRALGATKGQMRSLFLLQGVSYSILGYGAGLGMGLLITIASATLLQDWFTAFIQRTLGQTLNVVKDLPSGIFSQIDWRTIGIMSGFLLIIVILMSLIPANRAASLKPVEAIKSE